MATIKLYENVDDLVRLYKEATSDSVDEVSRIVNRHILICLSNEASSECVGPDPIFNIAYIDKLVKGAGASVYEIRCMLSLLQMTKDRKDCISNWDLLHDRVVSEVQRRSRFEDCSELKINL